MKKLFFPVILVICAAIIVLSVLFVAGVFSKENETDGTEEKDVCCCFSYLDNYVNLDEDGCVVSVTEGYQEVPRISGISFVTIIMGQVPQAAKEGYEEYALKLIRLFSANSIGDIDEVSISEEGEAVVYIGAIEIEFGADNETEEKLTDLAAFYGQLEGLSGTLNMKQVSSAELGYAFREK